MFLSVPDRLKTTKDNNKKKKYDYFCCGKHPIIYFSAHGRIKNKPHRYKNAHKQHRNELISLSSKVFPFILQDRTILIWFVRRYFSSFSLSRTTYYYAFNSNILLKSSVQVTSDVRHCGINGVYKKTKKQNKLRDARFCFDVHNKRMFYRNNRKKMKIN